MDHRDNLLFLLLIQPGIAAAVKHRNNAIGLPAVSIHLLHHLLGDTAWFANRNRNLPLLLNQSAHLRHGGQNYRSKHDPDNKTQCSPALQLVHKRSPFVTVIISPFVIDNRLKNPLHLLWCNTCNVEVIITSW
ncbi:hypothetical protein D3C75_986670 [compost metagenome]